MPMSPSTHPLKAATTFIPQDELTCVFNSAPPCQIETHRDGQRVRYFQDDDAIDLQEMVRREKMSTAGEQNALYSRMAAKVGGASFVCLEALWLLDNKVLIFCQSPRGVGGGGGVWPRPASEGHLWVCCGFSGGCIVSLHMNQMDCVGVAELH